MTSDLDGWLRRHDLGHLSAPFAAERVDIDILADLTDDDLRDIGVKVGDRRRLRTALAADPPTAAAPVVEQRNVTVLFCDLVDSTRMANELDREDFAAIVRRFAAVGYDAVENAGGSVAKFTGDGFMAYFGYPTATGTDASNAIRAGLAVQQAVTKLNVEIDDTEVRARVGIATGVAIVGQVLDAAAVVDVLGDIANLAARIESVAPPGSVAVADATRQLAESDYYFSELTPAKLKGFEGTVRVHRVSGMRQEGLGFTPVGEQALVGRDVELAELAALRAEVADTSRAHVVQLVGEAGTGKSLIAQAVGAAAVADGWAGVRLGCRREEESAQLHPLRRAAAAAAGLRVFDDGTVRRQKLAALAGQLEVVDRADLTALFEGAGDDGDARSPAERRQAIRDGVLSLIEVATASQPLLVLIEDLHWADPSTIDLLDHVITSTANKPILLVVTARPTSELPVWSGAPLHRLELSSFDAATALALVAHLSGGKLDTDTQLAIVERADGVPLFVDELTRATVEAWDRGRTFSKDHPVPLTLHEALMARLDRLPHGGGLAPIAAALGRSFSVSLLRSVAREADVERGLDELLGAGVIERLGSGANFRHELLRELAYERMVRDVRQRVHDRAATALSTEFPSVADSAPHVVAGHLARGATPIAAVPWWHRASAQAARMSANAEVVKAADAAIELLDSALPRDRQRVAATELSLHLLRAGALRGVAGFAAPITGEAYQRARELADAGDEDQRFAANNGVYSFHLVRDEYDVAGQAAADILALAERSGQPRHDIVGNRASGAVAFHVGRLADAERHLRRAIEVYRGGDFAADRFLYGTDHSTTSACFLGMTLWSRGRRQEAWEVTDEALRYAGRLEHEHSRAQVITYRCFLAAMDADWEAMRTMGESLRHLSNEAGLSLMATTAETWIAGGRCLAGDESALEDLHEASDAWYATGARSYYGFRTALIGQAHALHGTPERGLRVAEAGLSRSRKTGELWAEAESLRVIASLHAQMGRRGRAMRTLEQAIEVAEAQDAQSWALRAEIALEEIIGSSESLQASMEQRRGRIQLVDLTEPRVIS